MNIHEVARRADEQVTNFLKSGKDGIEVRGFTVLALRRAVDRVAPGKAEVRAPHGMNMVFLIRLPIFKR